MSQKEAALAAIDRALSPLSNKEKLDVLEQKRFEIARALEIHESKMTNGTQGERVACEHLGLEWNATAMNGCDAWDKKKRGVELKCFKTSAQRANVQYRFPKRKKTESNTDYANRVHKHYLETSPGGHYWVQLSNGSTRYQQHWFVDNTRFAEAIRALLIAEPKRETINFGCVYCKDCKVPHRLAEISKILNNKAVPARLPSKVVGRCHNKGVEVTS